VPLQRKKAQQETRRRSFIGFLKEKAEEGVLTLRQLGKALPLPWSEEEKTASRFEVSSEMPDDDRQLFADFVTGLNP
jgi:hypothetical protein